MKNEPLSTYDQFMQDPERRKKFEESYGKFILVETLIPLLEKSKMPVRVLAKAAGVSPTIIQDIKSGKRRDLLSHIPLHYRSTGIPCHNPTEKKEHDTEKKSVFRSKTSPCTSKEASHSCCLIRISRLYYRQTIVTKSILLPYIGEIASLLSLPLNRSRAWCSRRSCVGGLLLSLGLCFFLRFGSEDGGEAGAILLSFVQTCRGLGINPREYLEDIFRRLMGHSAQKLGELLPDQWFLAKKKAQKISA